MKVRKRIFIIDDEVDLCTLMKAYFLRKNCEVSIAHTVSDALPRIRTFQPDIIFLDSACSQNLEDDINKTKEAAPNAEIIIDSF